MFHPTSWFVGGGLFLKHSPGTHILVLPGRSGMISLEWSDLGATT